MNEGLIVGRIFIFICILGGLFAVIKPQIIARWTYRFYKNFWNITEGSIPTLIVICRIWNSIALVVLVYLFITLPNYLH